LHAGLLRVGRWLRAGGHLKKLRDMRWTFISQGSPLLYLHFASSKYLSPSATENARSSFE
jgi:hypothetical protein